MLLLPSEVTHAQASASLRLLLQTLQSEQGSEVVLDAAGLSRFDSSALALLLECRRAAGRVGKSLVLKNPPPALLTLAQLYGVQELLQGAA